jgi:hypothetical protein
MELLAPCKFLIGEDFPKTGFSAGREILLILSA